MQSGMLTLKPLYDVIASHPKEAGETVPLAERRFYRRAAKDLCVSLPQEQGFYLWGRFEANGLWRNIYLGKGRLRSYCPDPSRARLTRRVARRKRMPLGSEDPERGSPRRYPSSISHGIRPCHEGKQGLLTSSGCQILSFRTTSYVTSRRDLIETMAPRANLSRPVPPSHPQEHTHTIVRHSPGRRSTKPEEAVSPLRTSPSEFGRARPNPGMQWTRCARR